MASEAQYIEILQKRIFTDHNPQPPTLFVYCRLVLSYVCFFFLYRWPSDGRPYSIGLLLTIEAGTTYLARSKWWTNTVENLQQFIFHLKFKIHSLDVFQYLVFEAEICWDYNLF